MKAKSIAAKVFDRKFDAGESILERLDLRRARRVGTEAKRVNVDFPAWMVGSLDREARRVGVTRQSLIKLGSRIDWRNRFRLENANVLRQAD